MVSEQSSGLRFDIFERVHLSEGVAGISALDEIELKPDIQVLTQDQQAILKGNLVLSGTYSGEQQGQSGQTLRHNIPVEITLPVNRIQSLDQIGVEIDTFDVDLLSARSLNVTGVLSLRGIETASSAAERWSEDEEMVFVHQAEGEKAQPEPELAPTDGATAARDAEQEAVLLESADTQEEAEAQAEPEAVPVIAGTNPEREAAEEKKELKIAFSGKTSAEQSEIKATDLKSLFNKPAASAVAESEARISEAGQQEEAKTEEAAAHRTQESRSSGDALEWKRLFISAEEEEQRFRKVRMCIVQKDETIELIAQRYSLNPREVILYNRLADGDISEGQIIYIP
jgi:stage VI sporulation protein D